ncbi:hypothetical protein [Saccharopolyspora pogona]|uniref:hypothetical protein n=1 Tax=Saccharopolyspora pogona TaxID=333966 RepID=UPI0016878B89|nr:hypothetical protein [Saccharopolyspora pogona]
MGTFGALPYFLTILFQRVHAFSALQTGLGFQLPALVITDGMQLGERAATRFGTRTTLLGPGVLGNGDEVTGGGDGARGSAFALPRKEIR